MDLDGKRRVISLDLGTASIGWALRERSDDAGPGELVAGGVVIFQEGFGMGKSGEFSLAAQRRGYRLVRRQLYRRKQRKRVVLGMLIRAGMVPLSMAELRAWTQPSRGVAPAYPQSPGFHRWLRLQPRDAAAGDTAFTDIYHLRAAAVHGRLDQYTHGGYTEAELLGRVLYNYAQRRGFQSNAKHLDDKDTGKVKEGIHNLEIALDGRFLAEYFAELNPIQHRLRARYTSRRMYIDEYEALWRHHGDRMPGLDQAELHQKLFTARPLRSQKDKVGPCTFEPSKKRVRASHPEFEWFRLLQFLQNIRYGKARGEKHPLSPDHVLAVAQQILERHPDTFSKKDLETILVRLIGMELIVTTEAKFPARGCPMSSALRGLLGAGWRTRTLTRTYKKGSLGMHTATVGYEDIWTRLIEVAETPERFNQADPVGDYLAALGLPAEAAEGLRRVEAAQGYAAVSLTAIRRITPHMEAGHPYHIAVCLAGMTRALGPARWATVGEGITGDFLAHVDDIPWESAICKAYNALLDNLKQFGELPDAKAIRQRFAFQLGAKQLKAWEKVAPQRVEDALERIAVWMEMAAENPETASFRPAPTYRAFMRERVADELAAAGASEAQVQRAVDRLYHHAELSKWKAPRWDKAPDGRGQVMQLETPYTGAIQNPAAMRALHETKKLLNHLLRERLIDAHTTIVLEMGRELNEVNKRKAIERWQAMQEQERRTIRAFLIEALHGGNPTADQEARARLWLEQVAHTEGELERGRLDKHYLGKELGKKKSDQLVQEMRLWHEQKGICLYSGRQISITDVLHGDTQLEHTIPRSFSNDSRMENLTLATGTANRLKRNRFPAQLQDPEPGLSTHAEILQRIRPWEERLEDLDKQLKRKSAAVRARKGSGDHDGYNEAVVERWLLRFERDYWADKCRRFRLEEVNEGFARRNLVDMQVITRYAIGWLKTAFAHVRGTKGELTAELRKAWGLQAYREEKDRTAHSHHYVDAVVNAYVDAGLYNRLAAYYRALEDKSQTARLAPPWDGFAAWVKAQADQVLVYHVPRARFHVQTKRKVKGKPGEFVQGRGVRGSLHLDTALALVRATETKGEGDAETSYGWQRGLDGKATLVYAVRKRLADYKKVEDIKEPVHARLSAYLEARKAVFKGDQRILPVLRLRLAAGGRIAIDTLQEADLPRLKDNPLNAWFREDVSAKGLAAVQADAFFLPVRKLRVVTNNTNPLVVRSHMPVFQHPDRAHKHSMYYANDANHALAVYTNEDGKKPDYDFRLVSNLEAARASLEDLIPPSVVKKGKTYTLDTAQHGPQVYRMGQRVLLYERHADEIWEDTTSENISKRLYVVRGISTLGINRGTKYDYYARVTLLHHLATGKGRDAKGVVIDLKAESGAFGFGEELVIKRLMLHTQIHALIEGVDFHLDYTGQLARL